MKKRFNVTIDEDLVEQIDNIANTLGQSRSSFLSMAAATYIQQFTVIKELPKIVTAAEKLEQGSVSE